MFRPQSDGEETGRPGGCDRIVNVWDISGGAVNAKLEQSIETMQIGCSRSPSERMQISHNRQP